MTLEKVGTIIELFGLLFTFPGLLGKERSRQLEDQLRSFYSVLNLRWFWERWRAFYHRAIDYYNKRLRPSAWKLSLAFYIGSVLVLFVLNTHLSSEAKEQLEALPPIEQLAAYCFAAFFIMAVLLAFFIDYLTSPEVYRVLYTVFILPTIVVYAALLLCVTVPLFALLLLAALGMGIGFLLTNIITAPYRLVDKLASSPELQMESSIAFMAFLVSIMGLLLQIFA